MMGTPHRGDILHVIWRDGDLPLADLRIRAALHFLPARNVRLWCVPASPEDRKTLLKIRESYPDLATLAQEVWAHFGPDG